MAHCQIVTRDENPRITLTVFYEPVNDYFSISKTWVVADSPTDTVNAGLTLSSKEAVYVRDALSKLIEPETSLRLLNEVS